MVAKKKFACKNEELVVICDYLQYCMDRDWVDFNNFSPKFDSSYLDDFKNKNETMNVVVFPQEKTKELKALTAKLYANMDSLLDPLARIEVYIKLAKDTIPISGKDFGITALRKKIRNRDAEGTLKNLQMVNSHIAKYEEQLRDQGLDPALFERLRTAFLEIDSDNQKQYELVSERRLLANENMNLLNELYENIQEVCEVGKVLYGKTRKEKIPDYTFNYLVKKVRLK